MSSEVTNYRTHGLRAKFAVALLALCHWCKQQGLSLDRVDSFFDIMWALPVSENLAEWDSAAQSNEVTSFALGDSCFSELTSALELARVSEPEARRLFEATVEIVYSSLYCATDFDGAHHFLSIVITEALKTGFHCPAASLFDACRASDSQGWGFPVSISTRDHWRRSDSSLDK